MLLFNRVGFALSGGMALIVVLFGFTLLSAAGLVGFAADDVAVAECGVQGPGDSGQSVPPAALETALVRTGPEMAEIVAGEAIFKGNCAQCHAVNEVVVGPALAGITKRRPMSWIIPWVKNSSKMVARGDEYAVALYDKYGKQQMPSFTLSNEEVISIVAYINSQEGTGIIYGAVATAR